MFNFNLFMSKAHGWLTHESHVASKEEFSRLFITLPPRLQQVLELRYEGTKVRSLRSVGEEMGVTSERIRQMEDKALRLLMDTFRKSIARESGNWQKGQDLMGRFTDIRSRLNTLNAELDVLAADVLAWKGVDLSLAQSSDNIDNLNFTPRVVHALEFNNVTTVEQLSKLSEKQLLSFRNFGTKSLCEVREKLAKHGLVVH